MSDLLPLNATEAERALSNATGRDVPVRVRDVWNPDTCPASVLAWMAWAFSVDGWNPDWTEAQKRAFIKRSIEIHRYKGTIGAVKDALGALFYDAQVQECFNQIPEGSPFTFNVLLNVDQVGISQQAINSLFAVIERTKNLRSHLDKVHVIARTQAGPACAAVAGLGCGICVTNYIEPQVVFNETTICM